METTKILHEDLLSKIVQTIIMSDSMRIVYTNEYIKVFHRSYKNGFIWRLK
jgi:hypothetical protein